MNMQKKKKIPNDAWGKDIYQDLRFFYDYALTNFQNLYSKAYHSIIKELENYK